MEDVERLLLLQYPVRCRHCHRRAYAELPLALVLLQADRVRTRGASMKRHGVEQAIWRITGRRTAFRLAS
jgi:hypothetical protein